jgi:hypothetical protein
MAALIACTSADTCDESVFARVAWSGATGKIKIAPNLRTNDRKATRISARIRK